MIKDTNNQCISYIDLSKKCTQNPTEKMALGKRIKASCSTTYLR